MPTFQPNPLYGPNGYDMTGDDGAIYPDPFGIVKGESDPTGVLAQTAALAPAPPTTPDVRLASNGSQMLGVPAGPPLPGASEHAGPPDPASLIGSADAEFATPGAVDQSGLPAQPAAPGAPGGVAGAPTGPPDPMSLVGAADRTASSTVTTSGRTQETSTSGLSDADAAAARGDIATTSAAAAQAADARQATSALEAQQATNRSAELLTGAADAQSKLAADQAVNDRLNAEVEQRLKAGAEFRPDRTELFGGDNGAAFGISAAVAAMCGGWLMGLGKTGGRNPYLDVVLKLIDDNANDQIRKNSTTVQELMRQKGDINAVKADLKARQLRVADQLVEARMLRDKSELIKSQGAAARADFAAQDSKWQGEQKRALMKTESKKLSTTLNTTRTQSTQSGGAGALNPDKQAEKVATLRKLDQRLDTMRRGVKSGALSSVTGWQSKLGANAVQEFFGGMAPEQTEQMGNLNDIMVDTIMQLSREPSNAMQDLIKDMNIPKNDRDIPVFLDRLQKARNQLVQDIQQQPQVSVPSPTSVEAGPR